MWRVFIGKDPEAGIDWRQEKGVTEDKMVEWLTDSMDMSLSKLQEMVKDRGAWRAAVHGVSKSHTWLSDWTTRKVAWSRLSVAQDILRNQLLAFISSHLSHGRDFPGGSDSKASVYNAGDPDSIPGSGRSPGEGNGNPLQYYCLENPMDRGAW